MKLLQGLRSFRNIFGLSLVMTLFIMTAVDTYAQFTRPILPRLSLSGLSDNYERDFYPDGRVWVPPTVSGAREFIMPVFITNNWYSYKNAQGIALYTVDPIRSFNFSLFYNEKAVRFVGVETVHSVYNDPGYEPLAQEFFIDAEDQKDDYYWYYINPNKWADTKDNLDGRRVSINGTSMGVALPNTDLDVEEWKVLFYVRFRVVAKREIGGSGFNLIQTTPIYIDNRDVRYNDLNVATQNTWRGMTDYDINNYQNLYSRPIIGNNRGRLDGNLFYPDTYLDGMNNAPTSEDDNAIILPGPLSDDAMFKAEPVYPGVITLKISDDVPAIRVASVTDDVFNSNDDGTVYTLPQIVLVDDNSPEQFGIARMKLSNSTSKSRLNNIWLETDAAWLEMYADNLNENSTLQFPRNQGRYGLVEYLDNSILGEELDPMMKPTQDDGDVYLRIQCDPKKLPAIDGEPHGIHVGYITIKSDYALVSPIRVQVLFLFMKNPYEPDWTKAPGQPGGINITMNNSQGVQRKLVFGTGTRATDGVDNLYGEYFYSQPLSTTLFDARWFATNPAVLAQYPFGFADIAPNNLTPRSNSRDIRAYDLPSTQNSHKFHCRFNNPNNSYPISVQWDINDFPNGAQLFIRQIMNGVALQATDMRNATVVSPTIRAITITDINVKEFEIEYTLPRSLKFVDEFGNPIINRGWNLLSMPLAPTNTVYNVVYKNAINIPWAFINSQYQPRENLRFGEGYFIKYSSQVDTMFSGAFISNINKANNAIKVWAGDYPDPSDNNFYGGWNLVGGLSVVTGIDGIRFEPTDDNQVPSLAYTKKYGAYGYRTDKGYFEVSNLVPGLGYWIKVSNDGYYGLVPTYKSKDYINDYTFSKQEVLSRSAKITLNDNGQHSKEIYMSNDNTVETEYFELPPVFSPDMFDVRFINNAYLVNTNESVINVQGVTYPISFGMNNADADYTFVDPVTNEVYGTIKAGTSADIKINNLPSGKVKVMKQTVAGNGFTFGAFPVPANDFTNINFTLPENEFVTVKLFDALGNEVAQFINEYKVKGDYTETISLKNFNSGNYMMKISAGINNSVVKLNIIK